MDLKPKETTPLLNFRGISEIIQLHNISPLFLNYFKKASACTAIFMIKFKACGLHNSAV
jgi:hypothetical protein